MKRVLLAAAAIAAIALTGNMAKAELLLSDETFRDLGATGFGNAPRLLNIQNNGNEAGGTYYTGDPSNQTVTNNNTATGFFTGLAPGTICTSNATCNNQPQIEPDKSLVYSVGALGWFSGIQVGIGLDTNEAGSDTALTFNSLTLTIWSSDASASLSFSGSGPVNISKELLAAQQGNGNSVFDIRLDATEQAQYDAFLAAHGGAFNVFESLSASFGSGLPGQVCPTGGPAPNGFPAPPSGCFASTDGQESFVAFQAVPGPVVGAGILPLIFGAGGLFSLHRFRRKRRLG